MKKNKPIMISTPEEVVKMMTSFAELYGKKPFAIVVSDRAKAKRIMEWFGCCPEDIEHSIGFRLMDIPIVEARDLIII